MKRRLAVMLLAGLLLTACTSMVETDVHRDQTHG